MSTVDPELGRLLVLELQRHLVTLAAETDLESSRRALHALKGSAGLAGERALAEALQRLERRLRESDNTAVADAAEVVRTAIARLTRGASAIEEDWPIPPPSLLPRPIDPLVRAQYAAEIADRLAQIDEALSHESDPIDAVTTIFRQVHTMKGAAGAVGDEPLGWFCHGLEDLLRSATTTREGALAALRETSRWRAVMGGLLEDPEAALRTLRVGVTRSRPSSIAPRFTSSMGTASASNNPREAEDRVSYGAVPENEPTIRVAASAVDRLLDSVVTQDGVRESISSQGDRAREAARTSRRLRGDLIDALRLIGPPRPWGAPAAALRRIEAAASQLTALADEHERAGTDLRHADHALREGAHTVSRELSTMRLTPIKRLFSRMASAVESEARRTDRAVAVRTLGADETVDRRLAEALVEPCLQLARNAAAHGIEPTAVREANGKPGVGTLTLSARRVGGRLVLTISDDGAGVDVAAVRERAIASGQVTRALAQAADDNTLLALLFLPGFSTRDSSDLLAGRGIGLDLALASVQKLGGAIRLSSRQGEGFEARVEVPVESGLATVLWVRAGDLELGLLAATTRRVDFNEGEGRTRVAHLAACLEPRPNAPARFAIELHLGEAARRRGDDATPVIVGVDEVGRMEDVLVRPLSPRLAALGPFAGVIVRGDGSVRFAIDPFALAPRARALGRVPDGRTSEFPGGPPALPSGSLPLDLLRDESSRDPW
jgi:two-component system chemotaxis sensor kinase CheA